MQPRTPIAFTIAALAALVLALMVHAATYTVSLTGTATAATGACAPGTQGLVRGTARFAGGTLVAENGCAIRAVTTHVDAPVDNGQFSANYGSLSWWQDMRNNGHFNALRAAAYTEWGAGSPRTNSQTMANLQSQLDTMVGLAEQVGMYLIIDNHSFPGPGGAGDNPPDWGTGQYGNQTFWDAIAPRYASHTSVIYEIHNEPDSDSNIPGHYSASYNRIHASQAPNQIMILNTYNCSQGGSVGDLQSEASSGVDFTHYAIDGTHSYCQTDPNVEVSNLKATQSAGYNIVQTEFTNTAGNGAPAPNAFIQALEGAKISWMIYAPGWVDAGTGVDHGGVGGDSISITWAANQ